MTRSAVRLRLQSDVTGALLVMAHAFRFALATHAMKKEYKIKCKVPNDAGIDALFRRLPSPINREPLAEIYNYKVQADGFYFVDKLVDATTASVALRVFIDAALASNRTIEISEL
jgi:hypothetical protein